MSSPELSPITVSPVLLSLPSPLSIIKTDNLSKSQDILREATNIVKEKFDFYFSTIQVEEERVEIDGADDIDITRAKERRQAQYHGGHIQD